MEIKRALGVFLGTAALASLAIGGIVTLRLGLSMISPSQGLAMMWGGGSVLVAGSLLALYLRRSADDGTYPNAIDGISNLLPGIDEVAIYGVKLYDNEYILVSDGGMTKALYRIPNEGFKETSSIPKSKVPVLIEELKRRYESSIKDAAREALH